MTIDKTRYQEHASMLGRANTEMLAVVLAEMLEFDLERVKLLLVTSCPPHESTIAALQGEAQAYRKYMKFLKSL